MIIDFHSHILPGIDDGAKSVEESLELLDMLARDGVEVVAATPHFNCHEQSVDEFVSKRNAAFSLLQKRLGPSHPRIVLGAEVLYSAALESMPDIKKLCLAGTDYLLMEMPYLRITGDMIQTVSDIIDGAQIRLIVAHIERYLNFTDYDDLYELMCLDAAGQINTTALEGRKSLRLCRRLIKDGFVHVLGTDLHNLSRSYIPMKKAREVISKKFGGRFVSEIDENGEKILADKSIFEILKR